MQMKFFPGQRWMSLTEPELGLGIIHTVDAKSLKVNFRASETERTYGLTTAPLKRVLFEKTDIIFNFENKEFHVEDVIELEDHTVEYICSEGVVKEEELADAQAFNRPEEKLFNGQVDSNRFFHLRQKTLELKNRYQQDPHKGFYGGKISIIPHQVYVAKKVCEQSFPRVLLADEVGLGKTIESATIINHMLASNRVKRVMILVPDSLAFQWFFELHRKFQNTFQIINQEMELEPGSNPFADNEKVIVSLGLLKGSQVAQDLLDQVEFDMLVVDEAHLYEWHHGEASWEYELLEKLSLKVPSLLLLTATPEQVGMEGHFARLRLLDQDRFSDYEIFKDEVRAFGSIADMARRIKEEEALSESEDKLLSDMFGNKTDLLKTVEGRMKIINSLVDLHGTGRAFYRNTRAVMAGEYEFFPKRILHPYELRGSLESSLESKFEWLGNLLKESNDKFLLICHSKSTILRAEKYLKETIAGVKTALFHSGLGLMARDRQAAYFADPDGAQILLCTEIGSEGRNFEFAQNLILLDLPKKPDLLEQRIGRLDRIGQKGNIQIHVPFISKTSEETLYKIYHEGLNSFEKFSTVGTPTFVHFSDEIHNVLEGNENNSLISEISDYSKKLELELEKSRDFLIEMNSYQPGIANEFVSEIRKNNDDEEFKNYMDLVFESFGVHTEEISPDVYFIRPDDNMFLPHFPYLEKEGMTVTFNRREAMEREDFHYLSWDHGMFHGIMDIILSDSIGNITISMRKNAKGKKKSFLEAYFELSATGHERFEMSKYFPTTLIRVLVDKEGEDFSGKWTKDELEEKLVEADKETYLRATKIPKVMMKELISHASIKARDKALNIKEKYKTQAMSYFDNEINRLKELQKTNANIQSEEIEFSEVWKLETLKIIENPKFKLDSVRLIL